MENQIKNQEKRSPQILSSQRMCSYCQDVLPIDYVEDWCIRCLQWYNSEQDSNFRLTTLQLQKALHDLREVYDKQMETNKDELSRIYDDRVRLSTYVDS